MIRSGRCYVCRHLSLTNNDVTCKAFPNGIPIEYLAGEANHFSVAPGQVGDYVFEPTEKYQERIERIRRTRKRWLKEHGKK